MLVGCGQTPSRMRAAPRYQRGLIHVLPGVEGASFLAQDLCSGLDDAGVSSAIEIFDWTVLPGAILVNLADIEHNRRQARRLADKIMAYRGKHPGRPVHVIGYSGGGGVAVLMMEMLPPDPPPVDLVILIGPAISPDYDLSEALRRTRFGILNLHSERDISILKMGTLVFGSIDRKHTVSAGAVGFTPPGRLAEAQRKLYSQKLRQVKWRPEMRRQGADGSHIGWLSRRFAREYLAPIIVGNESAYAIGPATGR
jgi:pimeloyl-ACP methyl ester carboxylesterase